MENKEILELQTAVRVLKEDLRENLVSEALQKSVKRVVVVLRQAVDAGIDFESALEEAIKQ